MRALRAGLVLLSTATVGVVLAGVAACGGGSSEDGASAGDAATGSPLDGGSSGASDGSTGTPSDAAASDAAASDASASDGAPAASSVKDVASTGGHACAVLADGRLVCWGDNREGDLGDGTTTQRNAPVDVLGVAGATAVSVAGYHTCAIVAGGAVKCWGNDYGGVLGDGATNRSLVPLDVAGVSGATAITTGEGHTCAILADTTLTCWGSNQYGQLGDPDAPNPSPPVTAKGITGVVSVGTGNGFTCAALADGTVSCWGAGSEGELGDPADPFSRETPAPVPGLTTVKSLSAGQGHVCAVLADGTARCWGSNTGDQLGSTDGAGSHSSTPLEVVGLAGATALEAAGGRTCALLADGTAKCWPPLAAVAGLTGATKVTVGGCAIVAPGVKCWGSNASGQLGDGTTTPSATPVSVVGIP